MRRGKLGMKYIPVALCLTICTALAASAQPTPIQAQQKTSIGTANTIKDLSAAANAPVGASYTLLGSDTPGDNGGGTFILSSTPCNNAGAGDGGTQVPGATRGTCWKRQFSGPLNVFWFGAQGNSNGTTGHDDTVAIQKALTAAANYQTGVIFPTSSGCYHVTGALTFDAYAPINMENYKSSICATGSGYTVLSITTKRNFQSVWNLYVMGPGGFINKHNTHALDGIVWTHPQGVVGGQIRVLGFYGRALYMSDMYDSHFDSISTEDCGNPNTDAYCFSLKAVRDTTNQSSIGRLQVEKAYCQAMVVDAKNINILIENLHSEQAQECPGNTTYILGGARSTYVNGRIESRRAPSILIYGTDTSFINYFINTANSTIQMRPGAGTGKNCWLQFVGPIFGTPVTGYPGNTCTVMFDGGSVGNVALGSELLVATGTGFGELSIDNHPFLPEYENAIRCDGCTIETVSQRGSATSGAHFVNTIVKNITSLPNRLWITASEVDGAVSIGSSNDFQADGNSVVTGNVTYAGGVLKIRNSRIGGNLAYASGRNLWSLSNTHITGAVAKQFGFAPAASPQFDVGEVSDNLVYAQGQPTGWRYFGSSTGWKPLGVFP